ncbi:MAG TPA: hypothetical protein VLH08_21110 [Acidobacteriota bacterium]|nr:hypothetical protein [Acidobacteriota bacterium]
MAYLISTVTYENYLHVKVQGQNCPSTVRAYLLHIANLCRVSNYSAVLIEEFLSGPSLGMAEVFDIVMSGSSNAMFLTQIAYVDANKEHDKERMKFAELIASNQGLNIRIFDEVYKAAEWLRSLPSES